MAIITDFGSRDSYIAEIYAILLTLCPTLRVVDITHHVPPGDIRSGSYLLGRAVQSFPTGTVFLGVIDPGVGSGRQAVVVNNRDRYFVGPDNGLFSAAIDWESRVDVRVIGWKDAASTRMSSTFHGRDLFAPVAGRLLNGESFANIGETGEFKDTRPPRACFRAGLEWVGEVTHIDCFGNIATNFPNGLSGKIIINSRDINVRALYYQERSYGELFWLEGSDGYIEVAANGSRADVMLNVSTGEAVRLICREN